MLTLAPEPVCLPGPPTAPMGWEEAERAGWGTAEARVGEGKVAGARRERAEHQRGAAGRTSMGEQWGQLEKVAGGERGLQMPAGAIALSSLPTTGGQI